MSRPVAIGMGRPACSCGLLALSGSPLVVMVDDSSRFHPPVEEITRPPTVCDAAAFVASHMVISSCSDPVESPREFRRPRQPFYRGLKKYRKP